MMLPNRAKKMRNFVLSHSHGARMKIDGTANHSHIGANQVPKRVGIQRFRSWALMISGISTDVFLIQNQTKSGATHTMPSRLKSLNAIQPGWRQRGRLLERARHVLAGGHSQASTGTPSRIAGMKNASHSRRRLNAAQKAASATMVPYAWTWNAGVRPATTPANR